MKKTLGFQMDAECIPFQDLLPQQGKSLFEAERLLAALPQHDERLVRLAKVGFRSRGTLRERNHKIRAIHPNATF